MLEDLNIFYFNALYWCGCFLSLDPSAVIWQYNFIMDLLSI